jgi:hypothetical protein
VFKVNVYHVIMETQILCVMVKHVLKTQIVPQEPASKASVPCVTMQLQVHIVMDKHVIM